MPQPNKIPLAFAASGDKNTIPESTETTGLASWREGFPAITSAPFSEGGVAPKRADFNGIFNALSLATLWQQQGGFYAYDNATDYEVGNVVRYSGDLYKCLSANGPSSAVKAPTDATVWAKVILTTATQSAAGYMSGADKTKLDGLISTDATQSAAGYMSAADKTKLDNTATAWTDLGTKLMTATVLRSVIYKILGVTGNHYADGHIHDLNYQTATFTIFNGWDDVHRANFPTGAAGKFSIAILVPFTSDLQNNTPLYEFSCCQLLVSEFGDVWTRKKENGSWTSWSYKNSIFPIDGTLTKKIDIGVGTSYSKAFRVGSMGFVIINDSFPSINTLDTYYQIYDTNLKAVKETTAPVYDFAGRIIGYAWVNANGVVFVRGLYTGSHASAIYSCIQYPVSV